jgi:serine/threonine-protein kinase
MLAGRYRAGRVLGKGGMGVVIEATHVELGTSVAIKLLRDDLAGQPETVERFLREARAAAQLKGEHVCRVHDFGTLEDGVPFMVMELLQGCDLATLIKQTGPLAHELVASYVVQACTAVAEAHALGIVHRDLKPTNLFRTRRPDGSALIKILDFGLAKSQHGQDFSLTQSTSVMGSPAYMSPEQLKSSKNVDPRSDIWSLGIVMYELVAKRLPFRGETITELALAITSDPAPALPPSVPAEFAAVVMRCMEKEVGKRYASIAELAAALKPFAKALPADEELDIARVLSRPSVAAPATGNDAVDTKIELDPNVVTTLRSAASAAIDTSGMRFARSRGWILVGIGGAVALTIALAVFVLGRGGGGGARGGSAAPETHTNATMPAAAPADPVDASVPVTDKAGAAVAVPLDAAVAPAPEAPADADVDEHAVVPDTGRPIKHKPKRRGTDAIDDAGLSTSRY